MPQEFEPVMRVEMPIETLREVFKALYPDKAELSERIVDCEVCDKPFWKTRSESASCSDRCYQTLRKRKQRGGLKKKQKKSSEVVITVNEKSNWFSDALKFEIEKSQPYLR